MKGWEKRKYQRIFEDIKRKHPDRIDKVAHLVAEEVKKGNINVIYNPQGHRYINIFYLISERGRYGKGIGRVRKPEVLDLAWKEVLEKASKLCGRELEFLPTGERVMKMLRKPSEKRILASKKAIGKSHFVKRAGEKITEVEALERVLRERVPEIKEEEKKGMRIGARKRLMALLSKATGLKESGMRSTYMTGAKRVRGEKLKKRRPRKSR